MKDNAKGQFLEDFKFCRSMEVAFDCFIFISILMLFKLSCFNWVLKLK